MEEKTYKALENALIIADEMIEAVSKGNISSMSAKVAIKGGINEMVSAYAHVIKDKEEQARGYKSAVKLADDEKKNLEKKIKDLEKAAGKKDQKRSKSAEEPEKKAEKSQEKPKEKESGIRLKAYAYKEKICKACGRTFTPRYGAQTICDICKEKAIMKNRDIEETAKELAEMG